MFGRSDERRGRTRTPASERDVPLDPLSDVARLCDDGDVDFSLELGRAVLVRTPATLKELLSGLSDEWTMSNEGPGTWSPYQVVGHMAHIEECDWMDRITKILAEDGPTAMEPVDREAGFARFEGWSMEKILEHFRRDPNGEPRTARLPRLRQRPGTRRHPPRLRRGDPESAARDVDRS